MLWPLLGLCSVHVPGASSCRNAYPCVLGWLLVGGDLPLPGDGVAGLGLGDPRGGMNSWRFGDAPVEADESGWR